MELLLPAGDLEKLKIAVRYGADAVYLGLKRFNARNFAGNFSYNELKEGVIHAHEKGVKVYVAFNTLIKDSEINDLLIDINHAYNSFCDAIIIQDYWLIPLINEIWPDLEIHLSTQSFIVNYKTLKFLKKLGKFSRVVLARELSFSQIKEINDIAKRLEIEIEIFCHGALCMCYSGQCLMSSLIGGRSGNRGNCAQPCRKIYNQNYLLSTKDLCLVQDLDKMISLKLDSLKIEGRMRSDLYLKIVCTVYRKYIDETIKKNKIINKKDLSENSEKIIDFETKKELEIAFNREFSNDYFSSNEDIKVLKDNNKFNEIECNKNVINSRKPINHGIYLGKINEKGLIKLQYDIELNDAYSIWLENRTIGKIIERIDLVKDSFGNDKNENDVPSAKIGDIVRLSGIDILMDINRDIYLTRSQKIIRKYSKSSYINKKQKIDLKRKLKKDSEIIIPKISKSKNNKCVDFLINIDSFKEYSEIINLIEIKYKDNTNFNILFIVDLDNKDLVNIVKDSNEKNIKVYVKTKTIVTDMQIKQDLTKIKDLGLKNIVVCNIGYLKEFCKMHEKLLSYNSTKENHENFDNEFKIILDYNLNIFNSFDLEILKKNQLSCIISPELNFDELTQLKNKNFYVLIHGNLCVARTKAKIISQDEDILIDETEAEFYVRRKKDEGVCEIYNSKELGVFEFITKMIDNGINSFCIESCDDVVNVIDNYFRIIMKESVKYDNTRYTFGHLKRGV